ncbi:TrkH family potassium uptake protein [Teichococcus cervicalis]|uniref:Potassium uptake protein, TrkH family n=1 Tax=Pseudoroseomonas cervicalis ATCC 49957 TaxID=525371 RepID=D5RQI8_9PROT|nr:potassium transporter TrkG [Pseudoroseomonas cervicalis]EFH10441.1 potassium uptake protein, TrkH family [Pseudoroseomonas cervicalis ATCC 49957]
MAFSFPDRTPVPPRLMAHPARLVPAIFLLAILLGTALLMLPLASADGTGTGFLTALFTATSAVCVTGLIVVDTATHWSGFGRVVILLLFQLGGFGIMSGATLLGLLVARRLRLGTRLVAQAETRGLALGDISAVLRLVLATTLAVEAVVALALAWRLRAALGLGWADAAWHGLFHAVSAFNNAGFSTFSDSLVRFSQDPLVLGPVAAAVVIGGIGCPVLFDLRRDLRNPARWTLHTKLTLLGTAILLPAGFVAVLGYEWTNPATLGALPPADRLSNAAFHSVMLRSAGFNALDVGQMRDETLAVSYALMLIGGGSAGTAGGIKVTTFILLGLVVWAVARGEPDTAAFGRRVPHEVQRQALSVVLLAVGLAGLATLALLSLTDLPLRDVIFEAVSATATVGMSTGVTPDLPPAAQAVIVVLMFIGRVGSITVATALALRGRQSPYRYPEERPIVG